MMEVELGTEREGKEKAPVQTDKESQLGHNKEVA